MKILFATYDIPYPLYSGGKIRAYNLIKQLASKHEITLFTYYRENNQLNYLVKLKKFCAGVHAFKRIKVFSKKHIIISLRHPTLTAHIAHYYHPEFKKELEKEISSGDYKVLHLESFYTSHLLGDYSVKQVLGTENIEWKVYEKHANQQPAYLRIPFKLEAFRTKIYEKKTWRKADMILAVSEQNAQEISKHTNKPVYVVPNGVDVKYFKYKPKKNISERPTLLFVGNFAYIQNRDAVKFLVKEIFPLVKNQLKDAVLLIVGKNIPKKIRKYSKNDINIKDDVVDIREAYYKSDILLAPLRASSGTQFKIIEAMAAGIPIITTEIGAGLLGIKNKTHAIIANNPQKLSEAVVRISSSNKLRRQLINNARKLIEQKYNWDRIGEKLLKFYSA